MDRLEMAMQIQKQSLAFVGSEYLGPMRHRLEQRETATLAEFAQEDRLARICDMWVDMFPPQTHIIAWYAKSKGVVQRDLDNQLQKAALTIDRESNHMKQFLLAQSVPYHAVLAAVKLKQQVSVEQKSASRREKFRTNKPISLIYESMSRMDSDSEEDEDDLLPSNPIEMKIWQLHNALEKILLAMQELVEKVSKSSENMTSSNKIMVRNSDITALINRLPEKYVIHKALVA